MGNATAADSTQQEASLFTLCEALFPICRSITGDGVRDTLKVIQKYIDLDVHEVPTGTPVLDWTVPNEWNVREAWIKDEKGNVILDFKNNNLHLLNYSVPVHGKVDLATLKGHLFTLPDQPDLIPYRTSYYKKNWGFCLSHQQYEQLEEGCYEVKIDTTLEPGSLTYGELYIPGSTESELLFTAHICHPSLANDNLSGISVLVHLAQKLLKQNNKYSYRFLFIPGTIGSITWLSRNLDQLQNIKGGLVASLLGDSGDFTYKKSRQGQTEMDVVVEHALKKLEVPHQVIDFIPYGYDERQFCAPAFDLPVGNLTRSQFATFPEYHTSADNLKFIRPAYLQQSLEVYEAVAALFEKNVFYRNRFPQGEPQLGKRGLYDAIGGNNDAKQMQMAMLWILNLSDGKHSLLHIAKKSGYDYAIIASVAKLLWEKNVLERLN